MLELTIDEKHVEVEEGATILDAARKVGVEIPTLCHDERLLPYGACRMCLVETEGNPKLLPACTTPATDGMVVHTDNERCTAWAWIATASQGSAGTFRTTVAAPSSSGTRTAASCAASACAFVTRCRG